MSVATPTNLLAAGSTTAQSTYTTASVALTSGRMYLLAVRAKNSTAGGTPAPTVTDGASQTWDQVYTQPNSANGTRRLTLFRCIAASTASRVITISFGQNQANVDWILDEIASGFAAGSNGATCIAQSNGADSAGASVASQACSLSAFQISQNAVYAVSFWSSATVTKKTGYSEVSNRANAGSGGSGFESEFLATSDTSPSTSDSPSSECYGIIAVEIVASPITITTGDTGSGADAHSALTASVATGDTGSGADASVSIKPSSAGDTGSGADATNYRSISTGDTASGAELTGGRTIVTGDTATGAEASAVRIVVVAVNPFPILPLTLAQVLRLHHTPIARLTFIGADLETVLYTVTTDLLDGSMTADRTRNVNRSGSASLSNETGLFTPSSTGLVWGNRLVRLERGAMIGDAPTYAELMTGILDNWKITESSGVITFSVWSRLQLADQQFPSPVTYPVGMLVDDALRDMAEQAGLGTSDALYQFDSGGVTLAAARTYDAQANILSSMVTLAYDSGLDLFDDGHGRLILQPFVDPSTVSPVWTFAPGELSTLVGATRSGQITQSFNRAVVLGTDPSRPPYRAEARVLNPADPLYNPPDGSGPVGDRPAPLYSSSDINSQDTANAVALRRLIEGALFQEDVQAVSSAVPLLSSRDVVRIAAAGVDDSFLLDQVTVPLGKGTMTIESKRVRSLI